MPHHFRDDWIVGWGPTANEISHLASLFDSVTHVGCLHDGVVPASAVRYSSERVRFVGVHPAGGSSLKSKFGVLLRIPEYVCTILKEVRSADVIHVRCPANISLVALALLTIFRRPKSRWFKYAGNWGTYPGEPWSYRVQKWWLRKRLAGGLVTVNGSWPDQPQHIIPFLNPCLDEVDLSEGRRAAESKRLISPVCLTFVGRVDRQKGADRVIKIVDALRRQGIECHLDIVGDGADIDLFQGIALSLGLAEVANFHGGVPRDKLGLILEKSHFILLPSLCSEGWPKVLSEGMAFGAVPLASTVSSIPQYLEEFRVGRAIDASNVGAYAEAIAGYLEEPDIWKEESGRCVAQATGFSYSAYLREVRGILGIKKGAGFA